MVTDRSLQTFSFTAQPFCAIKHLTCDASLSKFGYPEGDITWDTLTPSCFYIEYSLSVELDSIFIDHWDPALGSGLICPLLGWNVLSFQQAIHLKWSATGQQQQNTVVFVSQKGFTLMENHCDITTGNTSSNTASGNQWWVHSEYL